MITPRILFVVFISIFTAASVSAAKADDIYKFNFTPTNGTLVSASGSFALASNGSITSVDATMNRGGSDLVLNVTSPISYITYGNFYAHFMNSNGISTSQITLYGILSSTNGGYSGPVTAGGYNIVSNGLFNAVLSSGGAGGGANSGGAPSHEVNAGLGILLAGATVIFLRRKRGRRHELTAA